MFVGTELREWTHIMGPYYFLRIYSIGADTFDINFKNEDGTLVSVASTVQNSCPYCSI